MGQLRLRLTPSLETGLFAWFPFMFRDMKERHAVAADRDVAVAPHSFISRVTEPAARA